MRKPIRLLMILATAGFGLAAVPAQAQTLSAYETGRQTALRRQVADVDCYARVYARHAVVIENASGVRSWWVNGTPSYNQDLARTCGVDRLAILRRQETPVSSHGHSQDGAYLVGYRMAVQRGYSNPACYAGVYRRHARPMPAPNGGGATWYTASVGQAFVAELWNECRISR